MRITMVKKQLANGEPCGKCAQAEQTLRTRGLWDKVDEVVWAIEGDAESPGMRLAADHKVDLAPFFLVRGDDGSERLYTSTLQFIKEVLSPAAPVATPAPSTSNDEPDYAALAEQYAGRHPSEILHWALSRYGEACTLAFSGAEDVVLIDMASKLGLPFSVFCLDTGRLHPETYRFIEKVQKHYGITIAATFPNAVRVEDLVRRKGLFSFYEDGHTECCGIRKVEPLNRVLAQYRAWVTGQRRDQSPATRSEVAVIELDRGRSGSHGKLVKLNPLANWTSAQVWSYIREHQIPHNELHARGFISIGCEPCTRATLPGEHERAGRWWWEEATQRECGLHVEK